RALVRRILAAPDDAQVQSEHWTDAGGNARKARRLAEVDAKRGLVVDGLARAKRWGWPNIYTYSKALAERLIFARRSQVTRLVIARPAVIESALAFPFPGWNQGINTSAPLIWMASRKQRLWPSSVDHFLDVIPVDLAANALVVLAAEAVAGRAEGVYQIGTSD